MRTRVCTSNGMFAQKQNLINMSRVFSPQLDQLLHPSLPSPPPPRLPVPPFSFSWSFSDGMSACQWSS